MTKQTPMTNAQNTRRGPSFVIRHCSLIRHYGLGISHWTCMAVLLFCALPARPAETTNFLARVYTNAARKTLPYRLLLPKDYDAKQAYPVVVFLHGAAARGNDNAEPLNWGPRLFLEPALREKHRFFLLVPQCSKTGSWLESSWAGLKTPIEGEALRLTLELAGNILPR